MGMKNYKIMNYILPPDGYNGYEGGAPYWILPSGQKTYDMFEAIRVREKFYKENYKFYKENNL